MVSWQKKIIVGTLQSVCVHKSENQYFVFLQNIALFWFESKLLQIVPFLSCIWISKIWNFIFLLIYIFVHINYAVGAPWLRERWSRKAPGRQHWLRGEREFPFPAIPGNTGLPFPFPKIGNDFFIPIPVPKSWECYFSFPFPFPKFGNAIFHSRCRYREWTIKVGNKNGN